MTKRFHDRGESLWELGDEIFVRCPNCRKQATVLRSSTECRFTCRHCGASRVSDGTGPAGVAIATVSRRCNGCGRWLQRKIRRWGPHPPKIQVGCPDCSQRTSVAVTWLAPAVGEPNDPWFGLPLWLQTRCAGEVLWAFNARHLSLLKSYAGASLRERKPKVNRSLASRLPTWIKEANHREAVLRGVSRLEALMAGMKKMLA